MSRKIRKAVASTLALAMMAGNAGIMPVLQNAVVIQAATSFVQPVGESNVPGGIKGLNIDAGKYEVKAGDEFSLKVKITDNAEGFNSLLTMLEFDNDVFEIGGHVAGDEDDPENEDSDIYNSAFEFNLEGKDTAKSKLITLMSSSSNVKGDVVFFTLKVKVKEGVKDGFYEIPFDIIGDGADNAKVNRIVTENGERVPIVLNPTYLGAIVKVGNPTETEPTTEPTVQPTATPTTQPTTPGQTETLTGKVADASGKNGETIKTTLTVSGASVAGIQTALDFDSSALELTGASASGWTVEVNGSEIAAVAEPYQDNSTAAITLEFKAKKEGSHKVGVKSLTGASKESEKEYNGTGTAGTITVSAASVTPSDPPSVGEAVVIELGEATLKDNDDGSKTATVPIYAKNIGNGISTVQFNYDMDSSFTVDRVNKGDFECQWTPGTESKTLQFLTGDGCNIPKEGVIGKIKITIPAGTADGTYPIKISGFEGSTYDVAADRQIPLEDKDFSGVDGVIVIGNGGAVTPTEEPTKDPTSVPTTDPTAPTDPTSVPTTDPTIEPTETPGGSIDQPGGESNVPGGIKALKIDAGTYKVNAGDEFKLKVKITDNAE
ncbi:MAG: cohesin domain-containing protein, partial [Oscillospiraceae bacterium]|nr:cohesin domain-containing protein [Oscillospiraceae bacterium]